jgi:hypothetical protein
MRTLATVALASVGALSGCTSVTGPSEACPACDHERISFAETEARRHALSVGLGYTPRVVVEYPPDSSWVGWAPASGRGDVHLSCVWLGSYRPDAYLSHVVAHEVCHLAQDGETEAQAEACARKLTEEE